LYRPLVLAALLFPVAAFAQSGAQPAPRQMPTYQDNDAQWRGGTSDTYSTTDMHHHVDQTPPPPPVPQGYGYDPYENAGSGRGSAPTDRATTPKTQAQPNQGNPNDAAHRADRARTADLNRRPWRGYNAAAAGSPDDYPADQARYQSQLAAYAQDMQHYQQDQARYQQRMADWRQQTDDCARDAYACGGGPD
jgi:hypothetical protein